MNLEDISFVDFLGWVGIVLVLIGVGGAVTGAFSMVDVGPVVIAGISQGQAAAIGSGVILILISVAARRNSFEAVFG